jgi:hypothetical protein
MLKKAAPLIILGMFILATLFVVHGLEKASAMSHPSAAKQMNR